MYQRLPELLTQLKERGYAFERVDRLLGRHLRVNQVGYATQSPKLAIAFGSEPLPGAFRADQRGHRAFGVPGRHAINGGNELEPVQPHCGT